MRKTTTAKLKAALQAKSQRRRQRLADEQASIRCTAPRRNDLVPELRLERRPTNSLKAPPRNVRRLDATQVASAKRAIGSLGQCAPLIIAAGGEIIDGVARWKAAQELGLQEVSCIIVDHLTPEELRLLRVQLNRLAEQGEWDLDELKIEFSELLELDLPLEITGFTLPEIDQIVLGEPEDEAQADDLQPDDAAEPVCRPGEVWALGEHRIVCGDARDPTILAKLFGPHEEAALVLTDPPYNVPISGHVTSGAHPEFAMASGEMSCEEFAEFMRASFAAALVHLRDGGLLAAFIDWRSVVLMIQAGEALGLVLLNLAVWTKTNAGLGSLWRSQHELVPILKKGSTPHTNNVALGAHGRWRSNVWNYPGASSLGSDAREGLSEHPTVKPVAMLVDALLDVTHPREIVLDPFLGSGSTLIAAEKTGRTCRAVEIEPAYVDLAIRRWMRLTGGTPQLIGNRGETPPGPALKLLPSPTAAV